MYNAYFVIGAESSGTRMMTRLLIESGCLGTDQHEQYWDDLDFPESTQDIVFRRSMPHAKEWVDVSDIISRLQARGYRVVLIVTTRDWNAMIKSQVAAGHIDNEYQALPNIAEAYLKIFKGLERTPVFYTIVTYESIVHNPKSINETLKLIGRNPFSNEQLDDLNIYNGNLKWYKG